MWKNSQFYMINPNRIIEIKMYAMKLGRRLDDYLISSNIHLFKSLFLPRVAEFIHIEGDNKRVCPQRVKFMKNLRLIFSEIGLLF